MFLLYRRIHDMLFSSSLLSSRIPLLSSRTCAFAAVGTLTKHQEPANSHIAEMATDSELRKMIERFKLRCTDEAFRKKKGSYGEIVQRLAVAKRFSWIEEIMEDQKQYAPIADEGLIIKIITCYGHAGMLDHARKLFDEMPQLGYNYTVISFTCLLEACFFASHPEKTVELFREIPPKLSITPDICSFNILIKAYSKMGSPDSILSTITDMEEKEIKPNSLTYAIILDGFYKNGRVEESNNVWDSMKSKDIAPCIKCYNSKLSFLASQKRMKEALELLEVLKIEKLKPSTMTFDALFEGFRAEKNFEEAKRWWYVNIPNESIRAAGSICEILVPFATEMGDFGFATEVCRLAINKETFLREPTLQGVLDGLVRESKVEKARLLLNSYQQFSGIYTFCELKKLPYEAALK